MSKLNVDNLNISGNITTSGNIVANNITASDTFAFSAFTADQFPTAGVIEMIAGQCDGSTHQGQQGSYTFENVTSSIKPGASGYEDVPGSTITNYIPPANAKRVIYQFDFLIKAVDSNAILGIKFQIDGVDVTYGRWTWNFQNSGGTNSCLQSYRWVINCNASSNDANTGAFTSWTTGKTLKLVAQNHSTGNEAKFFETHYFNQATSAVFNQPRLTITAIA